MNTSVTEPALYLVSMDSLPVARLVFWSLPDELVMRDGEVWDGLFEVCFSCQILD